MGKHTLKIEYDYDFVLIGISSHEKDYRLCWALNNLFGIDLTKTSSLEIKSKKEVTPSFFSLFNYENPDEFVEYFVIANLSENKLFGSDENTLFSKGARGPHSTEHGILIPEHKQMNYFFVIRGEIEEQQTEEIIKKIKEIDLVLTAVRIDVAELKSKTNLVF
ncbi:MAG: IPExxxVDY family protein [Bacteroidota bacterium]